MRTATALVLAATVALGGCSPLPVQHVSLGDERWTVYVRSANGMRGLPGFGDVDGMLFDMGREVDPGGAGFVMDGVGFAIDIAWFDGTGTLVGVASMVPCAAAPCPLYHATGPYRWAIEAPVGAFADLGQEDRLVVED